MPLSSYWSKQRFTLACLQAPPPPLPLAWLAGPSSSSTTHLAPLLLWHLKREVVYCCCNYLWQRVKKNSLTNVFGKDHRVWVPSMSPMSTWLFRVWPADPLAGPIDRWWQVWSSGRLGGTQTLATLQTEGQQSSAIINNKSQHILTGQLRLCTFSFSLSKQNILLSLSLDPLSLDNLSMIIDW